MHRGVQKAVEKEGLLQVFESQKVKPGGQIFVAAGRCVYLFYFSGKYSGHAQGVCIVKR